MTLLQLWSGVLAKTAFLTRAEMDVYDKIACEHGSIRIMGSRFNLESVQPNRRIHRSSLY